MLRKSRRVQIFLKKQKHCSSQLNRLIIVYDNSVIEPYNNKALQSRIEATLHYCIGEEKYTNVLL